MKPLPSLLLLIISLAVSLEAATLRFLAWDDDIALRKLAVADGQRNLTIEELHPLKRSNVVSVALSEENLHIRAMDRVGADGNPAVVSLKVPESIARPLVILLPDGSTPTGLRGVVVDDNISAFPWGSFRVLNATGGPLGAIVGAERKLLPASFQVVDFVPKDDKPFGVAFFAPSDPPEPFYSNSWSSDETRRNFVILVPGTDVRLGPIAVRIIPEVRGDED